MFPEYSINPMLHPQDLKNPNTHEMFPEYSINQLLHPQDLQNREAKSRLFDHFTKSDFLPIFTKNPDLRSQTPQHTGNVPEYSINPAPPQDLQNPTHMKYALNTALTHCSIHKTFKTVRPHSVRERSQLTPFATLTIYYH